MDRLKIIIAEDEDTLSSIYERILKSLLDQIPGSSAIVVRNLSDVIDLVRQVPPFDICILDLTLKDADYQRTEGELSTIERYCPVLVVTGKPSPALAEKIPHLLFKQEDMAAKLPNAMAVCIEDWHMRKHSEQLERVGRLKNYAAPKRN